MGGAVDECLSLQFVGWIIHVPEGSAIAPFCEKDFYDFYTPISFISFRFPVEVQWRIENLNERLSVCVWAAIIQFAEQNNKKKKKSGK